MALPSLSRRIALWLGAYVVLLGVAVLLHGIVVNETAERLAWSSLLDAEMDHLLARSDDDSDWRWTDTETLELHRFARDARTSNPLAAYPPGLHDEVDLGQRELVLMVRDAGPERIVLALDISDLERRERELALWMALSALALVAAMGVAVAWGARRLVAPLGALAQRLQHVDPEQPLQSPLLEAPGTRELAVVAQAAEGFISRSRGFVERERDFINTTSHELRTPIAVITGAADLALDQARVPPAVAQQLQRIRHEARSVERLVSLLLVLARSPERLAAMSDTVALHELLPEIVEDHRQLCRGKDLAIALAALEPALIRAPLAIVQAAIGNLLRNAIENSDRGQVRVSLEPGPVVVIQDPGHGMSPEEISQLYRRLAHSGAREGGGIGLDLIARLCEHLGWALRLDPSGGQGTRAELDFGASARQRGL